MARPAQRGATLFEVGLWGAVFVAAFGVATVLLWNIRDSVAQREVAESMRDVAAALSQYVRAEGTLQQSVDGEAVDVALATLVNAGLLGNKQLRLPAGHRLTLRMRVDRATTETGLTLRTRRAMVIGWREGEANASWSGRLARLIGVYGGTFEADGQRFAGIERAWQEPASAWLRKSDWQNRASITAVALVTDRHPGVENELGVEVLAGEEGDFHAIATTGQRRWQPVWADDVLRLRIRARGVQRYTVTVDTVEHGRCEPVTVKKDASVASELTTVNIVVDRCWLGQGIVVQAHGQGSGLISEPYRSDAIDVAAGAPTPGRYRFRAQLTATVSYAEPGPARDRYQNVEGHLSEITFEPVDGQRHGAFLATPAYVRFNLRTGTGGRGVLQYRLEKAEPITELFYRQLGLPNGYVARIEERVQTTKPVVLTANAEFSSDRPLGEPAAATVATPNVSSIRLKN